MHFLPDVYVPCEQCGGKRYNRETLDIRFKGKTIADVLEMPIEEALEFFAHIPKITPAAADAARRRARTTCGSGSPRRRSRAARRSASSSRASSARSPPARTLYILDEPTTGLHFADIEKLLEVLQRLVDAGNSVVVIEHNLDVIKTADRLIDMGPEGGEEGGRLIAAGTPEEVAAVEESATGGFLSGLVTPAVAARAPPPAGRGCPPRPSGAGLARQSSRRPRRAARSARSSATARGAVGSAAGRWPSRRGSISSSHGLALHHVDPVGPRAAAASSTASARRVPRNRSPAPSSTPQPGGDRAAADGVEEHRPALGLAVVVDGVRARQEAEGRAPAPARPPDFVMPCSNQHIEPALSPASTMPACHASRRIASTPVGPPQREQVDQRAAADVDHVLREEVLAQRDRVRAEPEQRDGRRLAQLVAERGVEAADLVLGVAAGGGEQADPRLAGGRERADVVVERRVAGVHREPAAAHREDRRDAPGAARAGLPRRRRRALPAVRRQLRLRRAEMLGGSASSTTSPPTASTR